MKINSANVQLNPKGQRHHDHIKQGKLSCNRADLEYLIGTPHGPKGEDNKVSAEWYLVTNHGPVTVHDYWAFNEDEFAIDAATIQAGREAVNYFKTNGLQAYMLTGEM